MLLGRWRRRLPGVLFFLCLAVAGVLTAAVLVTPYVDPGGEPPADGPSRVLALFARDTTLRRTALASAAGLVATAFVFFRPPYSRPPRAPTDVIGA